MYTALRAPRAVVVEGEHAVVAVLAVLGPRRPDDVARDAVAQLVSNVLWDGVRQARRRLPWDDSWAGTQDDSKNQKIESKLVRQTQRRETRCKEYATQAQSQG